MSTYNDLNRRQIEMMRRSTLMKKGMGDQLDAECEEISNRVRGFQAVPNGIPIYEGKR